MKLSAILEPLIAAGVPGDVILATVKAFEEQQGSVVEKGREKARARWHRWNDKRLQTSANVSNTLVRVEDSSSNSKISNNKKDNISHEFESEIWPAYPRKAGRGAALKAYIAARKRASFEAIMAGVRRYAQERLGEDPKFTKHAQGWFSGDHWTDEPVPKHVAKATGPPKKLTQGESLRNMARAAGVIDDTGNPPRRLETGQRDGENPGAGDVIRLAITGNHGW